MQSNPLHFVWKSLTAFVLLSGVGLGAHAQTLPAAAAHFPAGVDSVEVPFSIRHGFLVITVELEGVRPLNMIVDTGAPIMVLADTSLARELTYQVIAQAQLDGAGDGAMRTAPLVAGLAPSVGGVRLEGGLVLIGGLHDLLLGLDGIIGASLFEDAVVKMDPGTKRLVLYRPEAYTYEGEGTALPLVRQPNGHIHSAVTLVINGQEMTTDQVLVDTGALQPLSVYLEDGTAIALPDSVLRNTVIGWGSRGPERGNVLRVEVLQLGNQRLHQVVATAGRRDADQVEQAVLGLDALLRFETIFDYAGGQLLLEPTAETNAPFEYWTTGFSVEPPGPNATYLTIHDILAASPASEADLQVGDRILSVDGTAVSDLMTQGQARTVLRAEPGVSLRLTIQRGREEISVMLRPRRLI